MEPRVVLSNTSQREWRDSRWRSTAWGSGLAVGDDPVAFDDWRAGNVETDLLRDVIDYWRSGEPVA
ncbi:MAG: hypothetical protein V5A55_10275 [Halovenus sp.]